MKLGIRETGLVVHQLMECNVCQLPGREITRYIDLADLRCVRIGAPGRIITTGAGSFGDVFDYGHVGIKGKKDDNIERRYSAPVRIFTPLIFCEPSDMPLACRRVDVSGEKRQDVLYLSSHSRG